MLCTVVGYKKFTSKAGKPCTIAMLVCPMSTRDTSFGGVGQKVLEQFIPEELSDSFNPTLLNKQVEITKDFDNSISSVKVVADKNK